MHVRTKLTEPRAHTSVFTLEILKHPTEFHETSCESYAMGTN